jgi:hypothetical protein
MPSEAKVSKPYIRPATLIDCVYLSANLRKEDREELMHGTGKGPLEVILTGFHTDHETHAVVYQDLVVAVLGVGGMPGMVGYPWMLATDDLKKIRKTFLRGCRGLLKDILTRFPYLENHVWAKNAVHIQWLQWLGFSFDPAKPHGINNEPFHRFYMKDEQCVNQ